MQLGSLEKILISSPDYKQFRYMGTPKLANATSQQLA